MTIEAVGDENSLTLALGCTRRLGTVVVAGLIARPTVTLPLRPLGAKGLTMRGMVCASSSVWPDVAPLVETGALRIDYLVTDEFDLDEAPAAYDAARSHRDGELKVALRP